MNKPKEKYEQVKIVYFHYSVNFDTGDKSQTKVIELIVSFSDAKKAIEQIEESSDGEDNYKVKIVYDLFDNEPYSIRWLCDGD